MPLGTICVGNNAQTSIPNDTSTVLTFTTVNYDTLAVWNPATPDRIVVPAGCSNVRVWFHAHYQEQTTAGAVTGVARMRLFVNGALPVVANGWEIPLIPNIVSASTTACGGSANTPLIPANPGDYWQLLTDQTSGQPCNMQGQQLSLEFY